MDTQVVFFEVVGEKDREVGSMPVAIPLQLHQAVHAAVFYCAVLAARKHGVGYLCLSHRTVVLVLQVK